MDVSKDVSFSNPQANEVGHFYSSQVPVEACLQRFDTVGHQEEFLASKSE